jgi:hypothetical protein
MLVARLWASENGTERSFAGWRMNDSEVPNSDPDYVSLDRREWPRTDGSVAMSDRRSVLHSGHKPLNGCFLDGDERRQSSQDRSGVATCGPETWFWNTNGHDLPVLGAKFASAQRVRSLSNENSSGIDPSAPFRWLGRMTVMRAVAPNHETSSGPRTPMPPR